MATEGVYRDGFLKDTRGECRDGFVKVARLSRL